MRPQLLVVPRAGWMENAYYERDSRSLQFFSFEVDGKTIHTSLSRDIVAHETAHALIDGIDPDLYDALDPQSLALHEGIADLTAMLLAFDSGPLRRAILDETEGRIDKSNAFSSIGEQFGDAIAEGAQAGLPPQPSRRQAAVDPEQGGSRAARPQPGHHRRPVRADDRDARALQGAVRGRAVRRRRVQGLWPRPLRRREAVPADRAPRARLPAARRGHVRRLRASDPRCGRGLARDPHGTRSCAGNSSSGGSSATTLDPGGPDQLDNAAVERADLQGLVDSDWVAYKFADDNRDLLGIPDEAEFEVLQRVIVDGRFVQPEDTATQAAADPADATHGGGEEAERRDRDPIP